MQKNEIIQLGGVYPGTQAILDETYVVHRCEPHPPADLAAAAARLARFAELAPRIRAVVTSGGVGIDAATMDLLPQLRLVASFGVGIDAIDLPAAKERQIAVTNTPDVLTEEVADLGMGLLLAAVRRIVEADRYVRAGRWLNGPMGLAGRVHGSRLGIIGLGRIGRAIAHRAQAFGMAISYQGPRAYGDVPYTWYADPVALAHAVDHLILVCPGGEATRGLVGREVLAALGPQGVLVNVARGSVVDEVALIEALQNKVIAGAGLDVFADEPRVPAQLIAMEHVVLQPHHASGTHATRKAMGDLVLGNLAAYFASRPLLTAC
jgi:lactate dehydrogenase-like 2-hydroxyacid dehydrogenase